MLRKTTPRERTWVRKPTATTTAPENGQTEGAGRNGELRGRGLRHLAARAAKNGQKIDVIRDKKLATNVE